MTQFETWIRDVFHVTGSTTFEPHPWQIQLAANDKCCNRLIRIPTGLGKTLGVLLAWAFHRMHRQDTSWPTRLVWCLPMRTLVEQTANEACKVLERAGLQDRVDVHRLMGGIDEADWYARPERPAILVGTQDMLLSRALNRGYAMGRAAWPRAYGLINSDALWVMDEVQLMGIGLTTSAQIQAFWEVFKKNEIAIREIPRATWWMSATLQPDWLTSPETNEMLPVISKELLRVDEKDRHGELWDAIKTVKVEPSDIDDWAKIVVDAHFNHEADLATGRQTLVVVNTVKRAKELYTEVEKRLKGREATPELRLIHSRFRPHERAGWSSQFLSRETLNSNVNRVLIATQVVEAGVDISASCLITELAPWPSLVQRFGRAARYGGRARVIVLDFCPDDDKKALPYALNELNAARVALIQLDGVSIRDLELFESHLSATDPDSLKELYPYNPMHVLMRHEFEELFDTSPDLSGAYMDVSRFIREGNEERDVHIFWRTWEGFRPPRESQPMRDELCSVSIGDARAWVKKLETQKGQVWYWDYVEGIWQNARPDNLRPGLMLMVAANAGGYDPQFGFNADKLKKGQATLDISTGLTNASATQADLQEGSESSSEAQWKTIVTHCREAAGIGRSLAESLRLGPRLTKLIALAMRLHDWGKAHPAFASGTYRVDPPRSDLAKAPKSAWRSLQKFYETASHGPRPGFRHELVSTLATLHLLWQANPKHEALLGANASWMRHIPHAGIEPPQHRDDAALLLANPIATELNELTSEEFNLLLFLIASHHGKVRLSLQASPKDQEFPYDQLKFFGYGMPIRGVREGDELPSVALPDATGDCVKMPAITLSLVPAAIGLSEQFGPSWSERMLDLVASFGPFTLGYLEAITRTADARASALSASDELLKDVALTIPVMSESSDAVVLVEPEHDDLLLPENEMEESDVEV